MNNYRCESIFLSKRQWISNKGNFEGGQESVGGKAFFDWCDKIFVNPTKEQIKRCIAKEYKVKIVIKELYLRYFDSKKWKEKRVQKFDLGVHISVWIALSTDCAFFKFVSWKS